MISLRHPRRLAAQAAFWLGAALSRIKTRHRFYRAEIVDGRMVTDRDHAEIRRAPCDLSMDLMRWSMRRDWAHWAHWANVHEHCPQTFCTTCGGLACPSEDAISHRVRGYSGYSE